MSSSSHSSNGYNKEINKFLGEDREHDAHGCLQINSVSSDTCVSAEITGLKDDLANFRSYVHDEVVPEVRKLTSMVSRVETTLKNSTANNVLPKAEIVVAGGEGIKSTIVLNVISGKWRCLAATYECEGASSFHNENLMYVLGGSVGLSFFLAVD